MTVRILPALALLIPISGFCGLEGLDFVDTKGSQKQLTSKFDGVNNSGSISFIISSGLDRRLRVQLYDASDTIIWSEETPVINTSDRLSYLDRDFYGKQLSTSELSEDGDYKIQIDTLDLSGNLVASESKAFYRDTQSPIIHDSDFTWVRNGYSFGSLEHFSNRSATKELRINKVTDESSGLDYVDYFIIGSDGQKKSLPVMLNTKSPFDGNVTIPAGTAANSAVAATPGEYEIGVDVYDKLGNVGTFSRRSIIDNTCPASPNIEVYNSSTAQWQPYTSGMTIYSNPARIRWGRDKKDFVGEKQWGWAEHQISYSDESKHYRETSINIPQAYSYFHFYTLAGSVCYTYSYRNLNFTYGEGVDAAPKSQGIQLKTSVEQTWKNTSSTRYNKPYSVEKVRFNAEPRSYRQKAWGSGIETCYIEVGETQCESTTSISFDSGRGYSPRSIFLSKEDGSLNIHTGYVYAYWDLNAPVVSSFSFDETTKRMTVKTHDADTVSDWRSGLWTTTKVYAKARTDGNERTVNHIKNTRLDTNNNEWEVDFSGLPDAQYDVDIFAVDSFGNESVAAQTSILMDTTAPTISISNQNGDLSIISDILKLRVSVSDQNSPILKSARLFGSSSNENVYLATVSLGEGQYALEKPVVFPTLFEGERYSLELIAEDRFANRSSKTISFSYIPDNLIFMELQDYLSIDQALSDSSDSPLAVVKSFSALEIEGGMLASGIQEGLINNRKNSDFPISVETVDGVVIVAPGDTKSIRVDLGEGNPLEVAIYPAAIAEGTAEIMFDIPQLFSKYN